MEANYETTSVLPSISIDESFCFLIICLRLTKFWISFVASLLASDNALLTLQKFWISFGAFGVC